MSRLTASLSQLRPSGVLLLLLLSPAATPFSQELPDDAELRKQLATAQNLLGKTPDRASVLYFIATVDAQLREPHEAIVNLSECIAAKEGFDPVGDPAFAALRTSSDFQRLTEQVHKDFPQVRHAQLAFATNEKDIIPEGLAYDPAQDVFYLGSMHLKKIVRIPRRTPAKSSDFAGGSRSSILPVLGIRMDPRDNTVWAASWIEHGATELLHFDANGVLLGRFSPGESPKHGFNDLIILRDGAVFLTDTLGNQVFRFDPKTKTFQTLPFGRQPSMPNGIAIADDEQFLYVADVFGILRYDLKTGRSGELFPGPSNTVAGADGLYWHKGSLIAVQNGIGSPRIVAFQLASDGLHVSKTTVLENRTAFTTLPTTGAIRGNEFYFIVNSQVDNLNGDRVLDSTRLAPVKIGVLTLP
jgi:hypothetical protein